MHRATARKWLCVTGKTHQEGLALGDDDMKLRQGWELGNLDWGECCFFILVLQSINQ